MKILTKENLKLNLPIIDHDGDLGYISNIDDYSFYITYPFGGLNMRKGEESGTFSIDSWLIQESYQKIYITCCLDRLCPTRVRQWPENNYR